VDDVPFLPAADQDYQEAFHWYLKRSPRAALDFEEAVEQGLREISETPDRWPLLDERHRFHLLKRYPYYLVYRIDGEQVLIVAVAHGRRRLGYWKGRD
jgi:plasmid stabilization system protein ParE